MFLSKKPIRYACAGFVALQLATHPAAFPTAWTDDPLNQPERPSKAAPATQPGPVIEPIPLHQPPAPDQPDPLNQPDSPGKPAAPTRRSAADPKVQSSPTTSPSGLPSILGNDLPAAGWIGAAQDLRATAEIAERLSERLADVMQSAFFHFAEASRHFDPLGLKGNAATIARQHDTIARQSDIIQELLKAEISRLETENATLRRAARQNDVIQDLLRAEIKRLEGADAPTSQAAADEDSNR